MARIPLIEAQRSQVMNVPGSQASPDAFGAGIGRAVQVLGRQIGGAAQDLEQEAERRRNEGVANSVANFDYTKRNLERQANAPADGAGLYDGTSEDYETAVADYTNNITDNEQRKQVRDRLLQRKNQYLSANAQAEQSLKVNNAKDEANSGLDTIQNKVRSDPTQFDTALQDSKAVIASRPMPEATKAAMQRAAESQLSEARFDGMLQRAESVADIDAAEKELADPKWQGRIDAQRYDRLLNQFRTTRTAMSSKFHSEISASLDGMTSRANDPSVLIPDDELKEAGALVKQYGTPQQQRKYYSILAKQDIYRSEAKLNEPQLRARIRGGAAQADPSKSLPIITGSQAGRVGSPDVEGVNPDTLNRFRAVQDAFGQSVPVVSGFRDPERNARAGGAKGSRHMHGDALDLDVSSMSKEQRIELIRTASAQGFTGIGVYENSIHLDTGNRRAWGPSHSADSVPMWARAAINSHVNDGSGVAGFVDKLVSAESSGNPNARNSRSSATGAAQFLDDTWVEVLQKHRPDMIAGKSKAEILAMRSNPTLSREMAVRYSEDNTRVLADAGMDVTAGSLYLAHFAGPGGAVAVLRAAEKDPNALASEVLGPRVAAANPQLQGKTVAWLAAWADKKAGDDAQPGQRQIDASSAIRNAARQDILAYQKRVLNKDMMTYADNVGYQSLNVLQNPEDFQARGRQALSTADYFVIAREDATPLTASEVDQFTQTIKNGTADDALSLLSNLQNMGPEMYRAAAKQLGAQEPAFGHAAALAGQEGGYDTAATVIRGQKRMQEDKSVRTMLGNETDGASLEFNKVTDGTLYGIRPADRAAIRAASDAYYVEKFGVRGDGVFDRENYATSVKAVLGGGLGEVNGATMLLPPGIDEDTMQDAVVKATDQDWLSMSVTGDPPKFADGTPIPADDIRDEGVFKAIGGGQYKIAMADGKYATTGRPDPAARGRVLDFVFVPRPEQIKAIAARDVAQPQTPGALGADEIPATDYMWGQ